MNQPSLQLSRRRLLLASLCAAVPSALLQGTPAVADELPFSTTDLDWLDMARGRMVPVRLYLPRASTGAMPVPLVVFSHGIGGSRTGYSYLGQHWAGHGIASLHLQHVGSDRSLWMGNPFGLAGRLQDAAQESEAIARVGDLSFALDRLFGSSEGVAIDGQRIVAAGHSYGANTTLLSIGARVERNGKVLDFRDPRIKAAIVISAPPFYREASAERVLGNVSVPTLHITATEDVIRIPGYYSSAADRVAVFDAIGGAKKTLAVFSGGSHNIFSDRAGTGGVDLNPKVKAATQALSLAFLRSVFGGDDEPLRDWPQVYGAMLARFVPSAR